MRTIITHFYNEEFLLPWWLEYHKKIFDFGILIDYASTDNSVNIIKEICPHWQIFLSPFEKFDHYDNDREVEFYERQIKGWRISLTVTEFLAGNFEKMMHDDDRPTQYSIPGLLFTEYNPDGVLTRDKLLWEQCTTGVPYTHHDSAKLSRSLHNFNDMNYLPGRHFWPHNTEEAIIFKFSDCLIGQEMIKRKLQIQHRVSEKDKKLGVAEQHVYTNGGGLTYDTLPIYFKERVLSKNPIDCSELIKKMT